MTKLLSLRMLIHSMTISEKKAFRIKSIQKRNEPSYLILYDSIEKSRNQSIPFIRAEFLKKKPDSSFETTVRYLFDLLLETMLDLRKEQDSFYFLLNKILKARVLYEKSLFDECFEMLDYVIVHAERHENYNVLHLASRLELEYLLALNFPNISEKVLLKKQFKLNEILKYLRKINEQSSLYEILKHRIIYKGHARSQEQKDELNDLVFSEISIVASLNLDNFEISKLHQLFQSNYLINVGDYKSALNSYIELNTLFEVNKHLWSDPPIYYLHTLEGVLASLRGIRNYKGMVHFIDQLKKLESKSSGFNNNLTCITFLYELFPFLDNGDFVLSEALMHKYKESLYSKLFNLSITRQAELCLYTSLIYFGNSEYRKAYKFLNQIILQGKKYFFLPLYRTIRLVNLMILFKLEEFDLIKYEIRSIKRELTSTKKDYKIEKFLLSFLSKPLPSLVKKRQKIWEKSTKELDEIKADVFEQQILRIFDFTAWIESVLFKISMSEIMQKKNNLQQN